MDRVSRIFVWVFHLLSKGYPVGQREDWRHVVPGNDILLGSGRYEIRILEA